VQAARPSAGKSRRRPVCDSPQLPATQRDRLQGQAQARHRSAKRWSAGSAMVTIRSLWRRFLQGLECALAALGGNRTEQDGHPVRASYDERKGRAAARDLIHLESHRSARIVRPPGRDAACARTACRNGRRITDPAASS
jgi:hypothetical protein